MHWEAMMISRTESLAVPIIAPLEQRDRNMIAISHGLVLYLIPERVTCSHGPPCISMVELDLCHSHDTSFDHGV